MVVVIVMVMAVFLVAKRLCMQPHTHTHTRTYARTHYYGTGSRLELMPRCLLGEKCVQPPVHRLYTSVAKREKKKKREWQIKAGEEGSLACQSIQNVAC